MATPETVWCLVDRNGTHYKLPWSPVYLGREECDIILKSRSVDPRHAVISHDRLDKRFKLKDLNSLNGTFVNESRIPPDEFLPLDHMDTIRFGYDPMVYRLERIEEISSSDSPSEWQSVTAARKLSHDHVKHDCPGCWLEKGARHTCGDVARHTCEAHRVPPRRSLSPEDYTAWSRARHIEELAAHPGDRFRYHEEYVKYASDYQLAYYPPVYHPPPPHRPPDYPPDYYRLVPRGLHVPYPPRDPDHVSYPRDPDHVAYPRDPDFRDYEKYSPQLGDRDSRHGSEEKNGEEEERPPPPDVVPSTRLTRRKSVETESMETVKKGTPLYGQPSWWGEEGADQVPEEGVKPRSVSEEKDESPDKDVDSLQSPALSRGRTQSVDSDTRAVSEPPRGPSEPRETQQPRPPEPEVDVKPVEPGMAFTVDFTDERPIKKRTKFIPSKLKKKKKEKETEEEGDNGSREDDTSVMTAAEEIPSIASNATYVTSENNSTGKKDSNSPQTESPVDTKKVKNGSPKSKTKNGSPLAKKKGSPLAKKKSADSSPKDTKKKSLSQKMSKLVLKPPRKGKESPPDEKTDETKPEPEENVNSKDNVDSKEKVDSKDKTDSKDLDNEDKVSEAGTYTIGSGSAAQEVQEARKNIDKVFGISSEDTKQADNDGDDTDASDQFEEDEVPVAHVEAAEDGDCEGGSVETTDDIELCGEPPNWVKRWSASSGDRPTQIVLPSALNTATFTRRKAAIPRPALPSLGHNHLESQSEPSTPVRGDWALDDFTKSSHAFTPYRKDKKINLDLDCPKSEASLDKPSQNALKLKPRIVKPVSRTKDKPVTSRVADMTSRGVEKRVSLTSIDLDEDISECDSLLSRGSDISESSERFSRSASKSKSLTARTNRTFALRRAKADNAAASSGSKVSSTPTRADSTGKTPSKGIGNLPTVRRGYLSDDNKSRSPQELNRSDGGRFSMRSKRSSSTGGDTTTEPAKKPSLHASRSSTSLTSTPSRRGSAEIQKQNEKTAWMRRKQYDARKSIASAKSPKKPDDLKSTSESRLPKLKPRIRRGTFTSSNEDLSVPGVRPIDADSDQEDLSIRSDIVASASRELARGLRSLTTDRASNPDLRAGDVIDSMFRTHRRDESVTSINADGYGDSVDKSYDALMVTSICRLSMKIKSSSEHIVRKLRDDDQVSTPVDFGQSAIPAWRQANQDLAGILFNLRAVEQNLDVIDDVVFPDEGSRCVDMGSKDSDRHRKRVENVGFKPIQTGNDFDDDDDEYY